MSKQQFIDLSHSINNETITYKGLPAPLICDYLSRKQAALFYKNGETFQIGKIEMVGNTGTYIDSPFHRFEEGKDISQLELDQLVNLEAVLIHVPTPEALSIGIEHFKGQDLKGKAVLIRTDWSKHWKTDAYFENHPFLNEAAALYLKDQGVTLVGIDSHNIDDTRDTARPVHSALLDADILIVEHLCNLAAIPANTPFTFTALPPKFEKVGTFPVRTIAILNS